MLLIHKIHIKELPLSLLLVYILPLAFASLSAIKKESNQNPPSETIKLNFLEDCRTLNRLASKFTAVLERYYNEGNIPQEVIREHFHEIKKGYKTIEYFVEYLDPELAKKLNGAPIPKVAVEHQPYLALKFQDPVFEIHPPEGLQVLEDLIFDEKKLNALSNEVLAQAYLFEERLLLFTNNISNKNFTDKNFLESFRQQLIRVMALGITGFDTPAGVLTLENAKISLQPVLKALHLFQKFAEGDKIEEQRIKCVDLLQRTLIYLQQNTDFDTFDRMYFIRELADPTYGALTALQQAFFVNANSKLYYYKPVNDEAYSIFDIDFLRSGYYAKQDQVNTSPELKNLGKMLFFDPILSSNNQRSCASCHNPSMAFTDGLRKSLAFDFKGNVRRNSPTLINAGFSTAYFWDGRAEYLQDQVPDVLNKEDELHGTYEEVVQKLVQSKEYKELFKKAFKDRHENEININMINRAIAAYIQGLIALNSPFDRYMRKETENLNNEAIRGFNLFMGKASCGTCHFAPIFNGTVPPEYVESETEVLGVPESADFSNPIIDPDSGRGEFIKAHVLLHSFKTVSVRNVELTAPYMHNGVFETLDEVIEFYDLGGGEGIGLEVPNQTLPVEPLHLTTEEKKDLIAFMISLTDTTTTTSAPLHLPTFPKNSELNNRIIGGSY